LLGYVIRQGKFVKWSPFMSLANEEALRASELLPFPTGKEVKFVEKATDEWIQQLAVSVNKLFIVNGDTI
jgi:hypothetical protein